ncbi:MAG: hypothetical protein ACRDWI_00635 [Jiangellaceae bacterium]
MRARLLFCLAVLTQVAVLYAPGTGATPAVSHLDKLVHAAVFAAVIWTGRRAGLPLPALVAIFAAHVVASEIVQHLLLDERGGDPADVLADLVGVGLGATLPRTRLGHDGAASGGTRGSMGT